MLEQFVTFIVDIVGSLGYFGIFAMMFLESSFVPFPSEVVMVPAGYLVYKGEMNLYIVLFCGTFGSLAGALFNYYLAIKYGRGFLLKYGNYLFIDEDKLKKMEDFFSRHGHISTFTGRLIPGVRQYISFPAGLAKMDLKQFSLFTSLGAGIWISILTYIGYVIGDKEELIKESIHSWLIYIGIFLIILVFIYTYRYKKNKS